MNMSSSLDVFEDSSLALDESTMASSYLIDHRASKDATMLMSFDFAQNADVSIVAGTAESVGSDDYVLQQSVDLTQSTKSLTSSRRRVLKHSSVVLNADKMKRVRDTEEELQSQSERESELEREPHERVRERSLSLTRAAAPPQAGQELNEIPRSAAAVRPTVVSFSESERDHAAAQEIQRIWRGSHLRHTMRFTQRGRWSHSLSERVFSLWLGFRVRRAMRLPEVQRCLSSERDTERVLLDLLGLTPANDTPSQSENGSEEESERAAARPSLWLPTVKRQLAEKHFFAAADELLARSLLKELLAQRERVVHALYAERVWCVRPVPHWHIHWLRKRDKARDREKFLSPPRSASKKASSIERERRVVTETPPHVKRAIQRSESERETAKVPVRLNLARNAKSILHRDDYTASERETPTQTPTQSLSQKNDAHNDTKSDFALPGESSMISDISMLTDVSGNSSQTEIKVVAAHCVDERPITPSVSTTSFLSFAESASSSSAQAALLLSSTPQSSQTRAKPAFSLSAATKARKMDAHNKLSQGAAAAIVTTGATGLTQPTQPQETHKPQRKEKERERESTSSSSSSSLGVRRRLSDAPHIQLEVVSGERLIPARKGAVRDPPPDRKPGLRVTLSLPASQQTPQSSAHHSGNGAAGSAAQSAGSVLKKVFHEARDYDELTLNPRWNALFEVSLPLPRALLKTLCESERWENLSDHTTTTATAWESDAFALTDAQYTVMVKALLNYWSHGTLVVEVCDGERFNEEIFMGHVTLLMTSFLPLIRPFDALEIKGNFTLDKQRPTQRVSGQIRINAFLHVPERRFLEEMMRPLCEQVVRERLQSVPQSVPQSVRATSRPRSASGVRAGGGARRVVSEREKERDNSDRERERETARGRRRESDPPPSQPALTTRSSPHNTHHNTTSGMRPSTASGVVRTPSTPLAGTPEEVSLLSVYRSHSDKEVRPHTVSHTEHNALSHRTPPPSHNALSQHQRTATPLSGTSSSSTPPGVPSLSHNAVTHNASHTVSAPHNAVSQRERSVSQFVESLAVSLSEIDALLNAPQAMQWRRSRSTRGERETEREREKESDTKRDRESEKVKARERESESEREAACVAPHNAVSQEDLVTEISCVSELCESLPPALHNAPTQNELPQSGPHSEREKERLRVLERARERARERVRERETERAAAVTAHTTRSHNAHSDDAELVESVERAMRSAHSAALSLSQRNRERDRERATPARRLFKDENDAKLQSPSVLPCNVSSLRVPESPLTTPSHNLSLSSPHSPLSPHSALSQGGTPTTPGRLSRLPRPTSARLALTTLMCDDNGNGSAVSQPSLTTPPPHSRTPEGESSVGEEVVDEVVEDEVVEEEVREDASQRAHTTPSLSRSRSSQLPRSISRGRASSRVNRMFAVQRQLSEVSLSLSLQKESERETERDREIERETPQRVSRIPLPRTHSLSHSLSRSPSRSPLSAVLQRAVTTESESDTHRETDSVSLSYNAPIQPATQTPLPHNALSQPAAPPRRPLGMLLQRPHNAPIQVAAERRAALAVRERETETERDRERHAVSTPPSSCDSALCEGDSASEIERESESERESEEVLVLPGAALCARVVLPQGSSSPALSHTQTPPRRVAPAQRGLTTMRESGGSESDRERRPLPLTPPQRAAALSHSSPSQRALRNSRERLALRERDRESSSSENERESVRERLSTPTRRSLSERESVTSTPSRRVVSLSLATRRHSVNTHNAVQRAIIELGDLDIL